MPEGDTLRRTARTLDRGLTGAVLVRAELRWPSAAGVNLVGCTVLGTRSYGKHLFTDFDDGRTLHTHLRMDGSWRLDSTAAVARDGRRSNGPFVRAVLASRDWTATGHRLGMLDVVPTTAAPDLVAHLGPDILADDFPTVGLVAALERLDRAGDMPIAEALLDQSILAGIGTLWMAESLFARRTWPWTPASELADPASLIMTARVMMVRSFESDSGIQSSTGETGRGQTHWVHSRKGLACRRCGTPVARGLARKPPMERPVYYCPSCQAHGAAAVRA